MPQSFEYRVRTVPRGQIILLSVNFYKTIFVWPPVVFWNQMLCVMYKELKDKIS